MKQTIPVIDMWTPVVPSREIMAHMAVHFPEPQWKSGCGATPPRCCKSTSRW